MADILELSERYEDVPTKCFTSRVPFVMKITDDNKIFPSHEICLRSTEGTKSKWVRISRYEGFVIACFEYLASTGGVVLHDLLNVIVMPYMSVEDAFLLHDLVINPNPMPASYAEAVQMLREQVEGEGVAPMVGVEQEKRGVIRVHQFDLDMEFVVSNYQVLWAKARTKCMLDFLSDPMHSFIELVSICDQLLGNNDDWNEEESDRLDASIEEAKRHLIFSMYQNNVSDADLHHIIFSLYPAVHSSVYCRDCQHCGGAMHPNEVQNSAETDARLESSITFLGYQEGHLYPAVEDAEYSLLIAEGRAEYHNFNVKMKEEFAAAREMMRNSLAPLINRILLARKQLSLMGVVNSDEQQ